MPADHLIGGVEGQGFYQVAGGLELGRINVAARGVGIAEGALKLATDYAQIRKTFGKPICEHQAIQLKLGEMATRARAARLLTLDAADAFDRGERCDLEAGMAKYFASRRRSRTASRSMRIHGAYGYSKEYDIERLYRDAPLTCIGEGTNEMQRIIIARQWIKRKPRMRMKPLQGMRILTVEQFGAGPYGTHVAGRARRRGHQDREPPGGDPARHVGPHLLGHGDSEYFQAWNLNKKSVTLDLKSTEGRAAVRGAGEDRRRVVNNLRGDQPAKLGLDYASLQAPQPVDRLRAHLGLRPRQRARRLAGLRLPDAGRGRPDGADRRARRPADARRRVDDRQHDRH